MVRRGVYWSLPHCLRQHCWLSVAAQVGAPLVAWPALVRAETYAGGRTRPLAPAPLPACSWTDGPETFRGMVEVSRALMRGRSAEEQRAAVIAGFPQIPPWFRRCPRVIGGGCATHDVSLKSLLSLQPSNIRVATAASVVEPEAIKRPCCYCYCCCCCCCCCRCRLFPYSRWGAELNARITPAAFSWLVGPAEVAAAEVDGQIQQSAVKIPRCRYLAESGCTAMCVNLCKSPTQNFFTEQLGMPLTMTPDFATLSCEVSCSRGVPGCQALCLQCNIGFSPAPCPPAFLMPPERPSADGVWQGASPTRH